MPIDGVIARAEAADAAPAKPDDLRRNAMSPDKTGRKSALNGSARPPENTDDEAPARKKERELFARMMRVRQYPMAPDASPHEANAELPPTPSTPSPKTSRR